MSEVIGRPAESANLFALRSGTGAALIAATVLASLVSFLDASVVNVAIPAIGHDLGAGVTALQWTLTGYLLAVATLLLVSGALADHFGRRRILTIGLVIMLAASIMCAAGWSRSSRTSGGSRHRCCGSRRSGRVSSTRSTSRPRSPRRRVRRGHPPDRPAVGARHRPGGDPAVRAVLAAVSDSDLGEASAVNDTAARLGG